MQHHKKVLLSKAPIESNKPALRQGLAQELKELDNVRSQLMDLRCKEAGCKRRIIRLTIASAPVECLSVNWSALRQYLQWD